MRLISLVNSANFFKIMSLARCEYSRYEAECPSICGVCLCILGVCPCILRGVYVSVPNNYRLNSLSEIVDDLEVYVNYLHLFIISDGLIVES
jgi:hypothetical protein